MKSKLYKLLLFSFLLFSTSYSQSLIPNPDEIEKYINEKIENAEQILGAGLSDTNGNDFLYLVGTKKGIQGKLLEIGTKTISFIDNNGVNYNLSKKDVRFIRTADGRTLNYNVDEDPEYTTSEQTEKDTGGLGAWGVVGIVLTVLLLIGLVGALAR